MAKHSDIPFSKDSSRLFLPWISMLMIFIASLTLAGGLTAYRALSYWNKNVSGSITVQIPVITAKGQSRSDTVDGDIEQALTVLRTSTGVLGAKVLEDEQIHRLMMPWIGDKADLDTLPIPKVIDVTIDPNNPPNADELTADLAATVPLAVLDTHRLWLDGMINMANGFMKVTVFILLLLVVTTAFTVTYSARTSLAVHKKVIRLVHMMGANDWYIAWQYAVRVLKLSLVGGIIGLVLSLPVIFGIGYFFETLSGDFNCAINNMVIITLIATPFVFAILAFVTTLKTVLTSLKRML